MIDLLWFYLKLGFWHVLDLDGLDHLYFIITLAIPYTFRQGKKTIMVGNTFYTWAHNLFDRKFLCGHSYFIILG